MPAQSITKYTYHNCGMKNAKITCLHRVWYQAAESASKLIIQYGLDHGKK